MISPEFELSVGKYAVHGVTGARVEMTRKKPADICELEFPNHKDFALDVFAEGDEVKLSLGFAEFQVAPVFYGTIKEIEPNLPLRVKAESVAGAARKNAYKETYASATWKDIAKDALSRGGMVPQLSPFEPPTLPPKKFRVDGHTPAQVLDTIAEETGWVWYAVPGTVNGYFGPAWEEPAAQGKTYLFIVGQNAYAEGCEIEYVKSRRIKKIAVTLTDGDYKLPPATGEFKAKDYEEGDKEKKLTFVVSGPTAAKAEDRAEEEYLKLSTSGFKGSFRAVGNPYIRQGARIALKVPKYDDNMRHATVESVTHEFGEGVYEIDVTVAGGYE
jgi:phage protein D